MHIKKFSLHKSINVLFCLFPISFIVGSLILTLNLYLFLILCIFYIKKKNYKINFDYSNSILICFFLSIIISSTTNYFESEWITANFLLKQEHSLTGEPTFGYFLKSILLLRFIILYFIVETLLINNKLNLNKFFITSFLCTAYVSFDVIVQYIFGYNSLGYKFPTGQFSGLFLDEAIAGGYIQKFSLLSIFGALFFFQGKKYNKQLLFVFILLFTLGSLIANNRMSMVLLFLSLIIMLLIAKEIRYVILSSLFAFIFISSILMNADEHLKYRYESFLTLESLKLENILFTKKRIQHEEEITKKNDLQSLSETVDRSSIYAKLSNTHFRIFRTAIESWKNNPIIGWGHKSFRIKCKDLKSKTFIPVCSTHPHNYQIEVLHEAGLLGFAFISIFAFIFIFKVFIKLISKNYKPNAMYMIPIVLALLIEIWPIKSSGSLLSTWNGTFIWLLISLSPILNKKFGNKNLIQSTNNKNFLFLSVTITLFSSLLIKRLFFI